MALGFDTEQLRVLSWRASTKDIAAVVGPPGCGKTTVGSALAVTMVAEGLANRVLLVAYTNAAANEFCLELCDMLGPVGAKTLCLRTGNPTGFDPSIPIPFSGSANEIQKKSIIISTNLSLKKLPSMMRFDNMIIDEAGVERLEHLLWPLWFGVNNRIAQQCKSEYHTSAADMSANYTFLAVGKVSEEGKPVFLGSAVWSTDSGGRLAFLNNIISFFKVDVDETGNFLSIERELK